MDSDASRTVHELRWWQRLPLWAAAAFVAAWLRTVRIEATPESRQAMRGSGPGRLYLLWHNQLLMAPRLHWALMPGRSVAGLVSASKDGAWLAEFLRFLDIDALRGSSSRLGREALHAIVARLKEGKDVAITPDGPRGPVYELEEGAVVAARRAGVDVVLLGCTFSRAWRIDSWDGFFLPLPFSKVEFRAESVPLSALADRSAAAALIQRRLRELSAGNETRFRETPRMEKARQKARARNASATQSPS